MENKNWTISDVPDLSGKQVVITGANSGLGFETAIVLSTKGANVIIACCAVTKGEDAVREIRKDCPGALLNVAELDLADLNSVKAFAEKYKEEHKKLDILINNAGIMMPPFGLTKDGFESQMGINHLGHFVLTALLADIIKNTSRSRVVNVSSLAHRQGEMDFTNLLFDKGKGYSPTKAYGRTKLANLLFTFELQRYFEQAGVDSMAVAAHPGFSITNLGHYLQKKN